MGKFTEDVKGETLPCSVTMDNYLYDNVVALQRRVDKKWDSVGLFVGYSGDGKTTLAKQMALLLDASFCLDRIVFSAEQFEEAVDKAQVGQCVLWDEGDDLAEAHNSHVLRVLKKKMKRIRSRRLHIIICTPTFFDMNRYFAIDRSMYLLHVYAKGDERGFFRFFNRDTKKMLYMKGKQRFWDMGAAHPNFIGRFTNLPKDYPIDEAEYEAKKQDAASSMFTEDTALSNRALKPYLMKYFGNLKRLSELKGYHFTQTEYSDIFLVDQKTISNYNKEIFGDTTPFPKDLVGIRS